MFIYISVTTYPSAIGVKFRPVRSRRRLNPATLVVVGDVVAVFGNDAARLLPLDAHGAAFGGVEGHLVPECPSIVGLDHIDFTVCRPVVCVRQPQCWPCPAPVRGVQDVKDKEAIIVRFLRLDPDRVSTPDGIGICGVDFDDSRSVGRIGQV